MEGRAGIRHSPAYFADRVSGWNLQDDGIIALSPTLQPLIDLAYKLAGHAKPYIIEVILPWLQEQALYKGGRTVLEAIDRFEGPFALTMPGRLVLPSSGAQNLVRVRLSDISAVAPL